jgi:sucrose phosphorylase
MKNQVQLITYVDRLSGQGLKELHSLLTGPMKDLFGGVHLLPFFDPIDGADAGFDPIDHCQVDPRLGDWEDIRKLGQEVDLMADMIVNHMSAQSREFQDVLARGEQSEYASLFLTLARVFPDGASEAELTAIYRPRPGLPYTEMALPEGTKEQFWTTFTANQIDIDVQSEAGIHYLECILQSFAEAGIRMIRLDAAGYAIKKRGTSCFMIPETIDFISSLTKKAQALGMEVLVEIHSYYRQQIEIAQRVDYVYDFALPPLVLHALFRQTAVYLQDWLAISPRNAITVLDTHDGIGIIDIGPSGELPGLVPDEDIDFVVEQIHERSRGESQLATGAAASNLDLYQVNCTYYDALGQDDHLYLLARLIQFFAPGVPQVYYTGLLAEPNDLKLLAQTNVGRDINRHYFALGEAEKALQRPVVQRLCELIRFRNHHPAFHGQFAILTAHSSATSLEMQWRKGQDYASVKVDLKDYSFQMRFNRLDGSKAVVHDWDMLGW